MPSVVASFAAAGGCAFDFEVDPLLAQRATIGRGRFDHVNFGA
jgi:hypothetical protein